MSDDQSAAAPASKGPSKAPPILTLVNTLAALAAVGTLYYTKILFKRPLITEENERKRLLEDQRLKKIASETTATGIVPFEPVTVNIETYPAQPPLTDEDDPGALKGKLHYVTMALSVEIVDGGQTKAIDQVRPVIMDQILTLMARKSFHELTTVQGRYVLRTQIMDAINRLTAELPSHAPLMASAVAAAKAAEKLKAGAPHGEGGEGGEAKPEGGEGGEGGGEGGEEGGAKPAAKKKPEILGPPIKTLYSDGLVSNVYFTQFLVK